MRHVSTFEHSVAITRVVRELHTGLSYTREMLSERAFVDDKYLCRIIKQLKDLGLIHITQWTRLTTAYQAHYKFGPGPDAKQPRKTKPTVDISTSVVAERMLSLLREGEQRADVLASAAMCATEYAYRLMRLMKAENRIHVCDWVRNGGGGAYTPVYRHGPGRNAIRPSPKTAAQIKRERRKRLIQAYGKALADRMLSSRRKGGADRIVLDGRVIYERRQPKQKQAVA